MVLPDTNVYRETPGEGLQQAHVSQDGLIWVESMSTLIDPLLFLLPLGVGQNKALGLISLDIGLAAARPLYRNALSAADAKGIN